MHPPREPPPEDWVERLFADGSGVWDLFVIVFYLPVILGALLWLFQLGGQWLLWDRLIGEQPVRDVLVGMLVGFGLVAASWFGERTGPGARAADALARHFGHVSWPGLAFVASIAAVGEELLFRGVVQPMAGLLAAAVLFAVAHVPFREALWPWTLQALLHGLLLGVAYERSEALVLSIVAHSVFNATQLVRWKTRADEA